MKPNQNKQRQTSAVFLDRDGVLNRAEIINGKPYPPANLANLTLLPDVYEALDQLVQADFLLIVITNQPDVAKGITTKQTVDEINNYLLACLPLHQIYTCFHDDRAACTCRKPKPGALLHAAQVHHIDLKKSYMVGDRWRDIAAGQQAGCKTIFIDYGYREPQPSNMNFCVQTLKQASDIILTESGFLKSE